MAKFRPLTVFKCSYGHLPTCHTSSSHGDTGHVYGVVCELLKFANEDVSCGPVYYNSHSLVASVEFIRNKKSNSCAV